MFGFYKGKKDDEEFLMLLEERQEVLYRIAYSYFKDRDTASDAVSEAVLTAYKCFHKLKDIKKFNAWITTILVNKCRELLRKTRGISFEELEDKVISISNEQYRRSTSDFSNLEMKLDIYSSLNRIDEKYRGVIRLKYFGDYTLEEIAAVLDIPLGTVKSRLNTGIKKLKGFMEVENDVV